MKINNTNLLRASMGMLATLFIVMYIVSIAENNYSIVILTFILTFISFGFILIIASKEIYREMILLNSIFILFYMLHMLAIYYTMTGFYNQWFMYADENQYFTRSIIRVSKLINKGAGLLDIVNIFAYSETALYLYVQGYLELLANYFDSASILTQKLFNVFIGTLIPTTLFYLLTKVVSKREAFYAAIIYAFFSFSFAYSATLLRDEIGAFLYLIIFYFYLLPSSQKNLVMIFLFAYLSYFLRPETGMYALLIAATYVYFQYNKIFTNKIYMIFIGFIILVPLIIILIVHFHAIDTMTNLLNRSSDTQIKDAQGLKGSMGSSLLNLPIFVKLPLRFALGQIQYFPPWLQLYNSLFHGIVFFNLAGFFAGIFWFFVWPFILIGVFKDKLFRVLKNDKLFILFILSIIYIALTSLIGATPRKLMYVYPILYLIATVSYTRMHIKRRKKIVYFTFLVYMLLIAFYLLLKYAR